MSPLANQDPLAQLNDIIAPNTPNWFPPAPIYWVLFFVSIALIVVAVLLFKKVKKNKKRQQIQLQKLQQLQQSKADFITLNQLLKGCALAYFPRKDVASLHGEQWFDFLQKHADFTVFNNKQTFLARLYQDQQQTCQSSDFNDAKKWISALPKQIKKVQKDV